jgi:hypothetical protein
MRNRFTQTPEEFPRLNWRRGGGAMRPSTIVHGVSPHRKRSTIHRSVVALIAVALLSGMTAGTAEARSLRIRHDGNDSPMRTDIRRVVSDLSASTVFLRIDTWQGFHRWNDGAYFIVRFDTSGNRGFDRVLEIYPGRRRFICLLEESEPGGDPGAIVGQRRATRANDRSVACTLPRSWFPRIQRAVRFYVIAAGTDTDRAPNRGLYRWL